MLRSQSLISSWYQVHLEPVPTSKLAPNWKLVSGLGGTSNRADTHFKSAANLKADIFLDLHPWFQVGTEYIAGTHFEAGINLNP